MSEKKYKSRESERVTKYVAENYDRIEIRFDKDEDMTRKIDEHCKKMGYLVEGNTRNKNQISRKTFIKKAIETQMKIDNGEWKLIK